MNRLREILELVESTLDEPELDGADLAGRAYLSRFHFDRLVAAALGEPPGAFRRRLLLERAAWRLTTSADTVIAVAVEAGYASPDAFTRAFTRAYGVPPSDYRRSGRAVHRIDASNGVHFHPPGGLRLPAVTRSSAMDVLTAMFEHHLWLVGEIVDRLGALDNTALDRPIAQDVEGIDRDPTLRSLAGRLVGQLEMWVAAVEGEQPPPDPGEPADQRARLDRVADRFRALIIEPIRAGHGEETFVDTTVDPPQTFSLGGVLAHVLTFSAVRRTMAVGALASAGVSDLGSGDPMGYVGGTGADASTLRRNVIRP